MEKVNNLWHIKLDAVSKEDRRASALKKVADLNRKKETPQEAKVNEFITALEKQSKRGVPTQSKFQAWLRKKGMI